jgi:hypothetical protein
MQVLQKAYGKCTLAELVGSIAGEPGFGVSAYEQELIDGFSGTLKNEFNFGTGIKCNNSDEIREELGQICFTHPELFLRFSRLSEKTQGSFLEDIFIELWHHAEEGVNVIEVDVPWGKNTVRTVKIEKISYNSFSDPKIRLEFSLI